MATKYITSDAAGGGDGSVETPYTLAEGAANCAGNEMHLAAGTYTLGADLTIAADSEWVADGAVTIDGADTHKVIFDDGSSPTVINVDGIIFTRGDDHTVQVQSSTADIATTFTDCDFCEAANGNDFHVVSGPAGTITVRCTNCNAYNGSNDGFVLQSGATTKDMKLYLVDCCSYGHLSSTSNGVTAHESNQYLYISGGNFYNNGRSGVDGTDCSVLNIYDASFESNGTVINNAGHVVVNGSATRLKVHKCKFTKIGEANTSLYGINSINAFGAIITDNTFTGSGVLTNARSIQVSGALTVALTVVHGNIISGNQGLMSYGIYTGSITLASIRNNTIRDCDRGLKLDTDYCSVSHNIFTDISGLAAIDMEINDTYSTGLFNGNNCFFGNTENFNDRGGGGTASQLKATDVTINPNLDADYRPRNRAVAQMQIGAVLPTSQTLGGTGILEIEPS